MKEEGDTYQTDKALPRRLSPQLNPETHTMNDLLCKRFQR